MVSTCCGKWPMVNTSSNSGRKMEKREKETQTLNGDTMAQREREIIAEDESRGTNLL